MQFLLLLCLVSLVNTSNLEVYYQWKHIDWVWPNVVLTGKRFIPENPFTQDVDIDASGRVFVTTPQWLDGTPITLSTVTDLRGPGGPLLTPYPHWSWHSSNDCDKLISIYRIAIACNMLWLVDVGRVKSERICPMKIMVFDLSTDRLVRKYIIPNSQTFGEASLVTPIVDTNGNCEDTMNKAILYIADVSENGIVMYDSRMNRSWRLNNTLGNAFGPDLDGMNVTIAGESFDLTDGVLGMALSPPNFFKDRYLYFNSLASYHQRFASVSSLRTSEFKEPLIFESIIKRPSQAGVQAISDDGVMFFQLVQLTAIACWNIQKPFTYDNIEILAIDENTLQYVSGMKVIKNYEGQEELWFNTNRLQKTINKTRKPTEINFRIISGTVRDIINGTKCEPLNYYSHYPDISTWRRI